MAVYDDYVSALNAANAANESRYQQIQADYLSRQTAARTAGNAISKQYMDLNVKTNAALLGYGDSQRMALAQGYDQQMGAMQQSLIGRGLGNTTVLDSAVRGNTLDRNRSNIDLGDSLTRLTTDYDVNLRNQTIAHRDAVNRYVDSLGYARNQFQERKDEVAPDMGAYIALARAAAQGGGAGGGAGGAGGIGGFNAFSSGQGGPGMLGGIPPGGGQGGGGPGFSPPRNLNQSGGAAASAGIAAFNDQRYKTQLAASFNQSNSGPGMVGEGYSGQATGGSYGGMQPLYQGGGNITPQVDYGYMSQFSSPYFPGSGTFGAATGFAGSLAGAVGGYSGSSGLAGAVGGWLGGSYSYGGSSK